MDVLKEETLPMLLKTRSSDHPESASLGYTCDDPTSPTFCAGATPIIKGNPLGCAKKIPGSMKLDPITNRCEKPQDIERYGGPLGVYNVFNGVFDWCLGCKTLSGTGKTCEAAKKFKPPANE